MQFFLHFYGFFIGMGLILGIWFASKMQLKLSKKDSSYLAYNLDDLLLWLVIPGIIGARIYHVIDLWGYYSQNLLEIVKIWNGGLGIFGALFGGFIGLCLYNRKIKYTLLIPLDLIAFALPLAQAIGRIGNFVNQELYGLPTNLPWGIWISPLNRPLEYANINKFHPLFAYEAIANLVLVYMLWRSSFNKHQGGFYFAYYLIGYSLIRFSLDFLRINPWRLGILTIAQWISLTLFIVGITLIRKKIKGNY